MPSPIAVNVGTTVSQLWSGRSAPGINTLLLLNTDLVNTVMVGTDIGSLVVPIMPNGSLSVDPGSNWYVVGLVAGNAPLVVVPNGQNNFLGISQGLGNLAIPSLHSPNYDDMTGVGWTINQDGSASFNEITIVVVASGAAILIYFPTKGQGNLVGSWAASAFTDQYGNAVPAGINVNGGVLNQVTMNQPSIIGGFITSTVLTGVQIANSMISGGTSYEQTITFDTGGGLCIGYSSTVTTVTQTVDGTYTQTLPPGVSTINNAFCWGAGEGGDGGSTSQGGRGGNAGEFGGELTYTPSVNPFSYTVGNGGNSSTTGNGNGGVGGDSFIDNGGVIGNGATNSGPGTGSTNTIHHDGGSGGAASGFGGGASGGNSGNQTAAGNNGISSTSNTHAGSPAGQTGSGTGGAGADSGTSPASNGGSPGAGGGGAGQGTSGGGSLTKTYEADFTASFYGPDANGSVANKVRSTTTMYQGGETAGGGSFNGNQRSVAVFPSNTIASDFAGYTGVQATLRLTNQHSWYNSGMLIDVDIPNSGGKVTSPPSTWPDDVNQTFTFSIQEGQTANFNMGSTVAADFINNLINFIAIGGFVAPRVPYDLSYYGYFAGGHGLDPHPTLTITGTKSVAGSETSGAGSDGKVTFQYTSAQAMVFGLSPVAGSDGAGNAFAAGYTGPVNAIQPGSSPAAVEGWHTITLDAGWSTVAGFAAPAYRMLSTGDLEFRGAASHAAFNIAQNLNGSNPIPAAWRPATNNHVWRTGNAGTIADSYYQTTGVIQGLGSNNAVRVYLDGICPLD